LQGNRHRLKRTNCLPGLERTPSEIRSDRPLTRKAGERQTSRANTFGNNRAIRLDACFRDIQMATADEGPPSMHVLDAWRTTLGAWTAL
jgi:hypothetical protein